MTSKINSSVGIPAIDLAHYFDGTDKKGVASRIAGACEDLGFFSITGHGIPLKLIQDVNLAARSFFDLPAATKRATATGEGMGYIDSGGEKLAAGLDDPQTVDKKESLNLGLPVSLPAWFAIAMRLDQIREKRGIVCAVSTDSGQAFVL